MNWQSVEATTLRIDSEFDWPVGDDRAVISISRSMAEGINLEESPWWDYGWSEQPNGRIAATMGRSTAIEFNKFVLDKRIEAHHHHLWGSRCKPILLLVIDAILVGWVLGSCLNSLIQDVMGKERYLKHADTNWMRWEYSVPLALVIAFAMTWWFHRKVKKLIALIMDEGHEDFAKLLTASNLWVERKDD